MKIAALSDSTPVWIDRHGPSTLGEIRDAIEDPEPIPSNEEATLEMWADVATRNLCRHPWEPVVPVDAILRHHRMRYVEAVERNERLERRRRKRALELER